MRLTLLSNCPRRAICAPNALLEAEAVKPLRSEQDFHFSLFALLARDDGGRSATGRCGSKGSRACKIS